MEVDYSPQPPTSNTAPSTPTSLLSYMDINKETGVPNNLASIAPSEMLNVWNATKMNSKAGTVNTADGNFPRKPLTPPAVTNRPFRLLFSLLLRCRKEIEVPILRSIVRLWNEPSSSHKTASSRYTSAMSILFADIHAKQHGATAHSARAQAWDRAQPDPGRPVESCQLNASK